MIINILIALIGIMHLYFFILESYLYSGNKGRKIFNLTDEKIKYTKVLAFNQGYYNLCLGIGLLFGIYLTNLPMLIYLLLFVVIVGIVGALSFSKKIFWLQAFPAIIALIALCYKL